MTKRKKSVFKIIILLVIVLVAIFTVKAKLKTGNAGVIPTVEVKKGDLTTKIIATGRIDASIKQEIYSEVSGIVKFAVQEGQQVKKGEMVLQLDDNDAKIELEQAQADLEVKNIELSQLLRGARSEEIQKLEIKQKQALFKYESAAADFEKKKTLYESGAISQKELEDAQKNLEDSKAELDTADLELKAIKASDSDAIAIKKAQIREAEIRLSQARKKLESFKFRSNIDGIVIKNDLKPGMMLTQGSLAMTIADAKALEVDLKVSEYDAARLKKGQKAIIYGDGFEEKKYEAVVEKIAPAATTVITDRGSETNVEVTLRVLEPDEDIKLGYSVNAEIIVAEKKQVMLLPLESIFEEQDGKKVMVLKDGKPIKQKVETGIYNELYTEITSGLTEGEKVIQNPSLEKNPER